ncbi:hypothetical protein [Streptomyces hoynatensis]|uniref:Uncharacterized protein n=1 Tax=Streptomyces hoynatensis TaxID=1141874 RepID=A0A3A9YXM3_9ACTN|nr:hypothetical protein [Streptomyces hoynatensis]RKN40811.1 hypothetical protein D7294_17150 [Streptomyces hoynatensis]
MTSTSARLADAIATAARIQGATTPDVRGADWHTAQVTAVGNDGTVDCGQIRARRTQGYLLPQAGDLCVLWRAGDGNWQAAPPLAAGGGAWTAIPLTSGYTAAGGGAPPGYLLEGRRVMLRGRLGRTDAGAIPNNTTLAIIPAAARPPYPIGWSSPRNGSTAAPVRVEVQPDGIVRLFDTSGPQWISLDCVTYYTI